MIVIGSNFKINAYQAAQFEVEHCTYAEVMYQAVIAPTKVYIIIRYTGDIITCQLIQIIVIPSIAQANATQQISIYYVMLIRSKRIAKVEHKIEVRGNELILVSFVKALKSTLLINSAYVQACAYYGCKHSTNVHSPNWGNEFRSIIIAKRYLTTTLYTYKGIRITRLFLFACNLRKSSLCRNTCYEQ